MSNNSESALEIYRMGLVDLKGGFKFASEVTNGRVYFFGTGRNN